MRASRLLRSVALPLPSLPPFPSALADCAASRELADCKAVWGVPRTTAIQKPRLSGIGIQHSMKEYEGTVKLRCC